MTDSAEKQSAAEEKNNDKKEKDPPSQMSVRNNQDAALSVDKETAFFLASGGRSEHMLVNTGEKRLAVKIRCSNNKVYRVTPVHMFVDVGQCQSLIVTRVLGPTRNDKLVVQYMACKPEDKDPRDVFQEAKNKPECIRINLKVLAPEELAAIGTECASSDGNTKKKGTKESC